MLEPTVPPAAVKPVIAARSIVGAVAVPAIAMFEEDTAVTDATLLPSTYAFKAVLADVTVFAAAAFVVLVEPTEASSCTKPEFVKLPVYFSVTML